MSQRLFDALSEVSERIRHAPHLLLCLDFDGTLTPIAEDPGIVYLSPPMRDMVQSLAGSRNTSVAIISGRERADLQGRVGIPDVIYAGNHGLEISGPGFIFVAPTAVACRPALQELAATLAARLQPVPGARVEDKGLTISVHHRQVAASDSEQVRHIVHAVLAGSSHPFVLRLGDKVYEIRPRVYWNKGTAVNWIKEQLVKPDALVIYVGDDLTDEDAFSALADGITVKVGNGAESAANYHVEGPAEVRQFLNWLADRLH